MSLEQRINYQLNKYPTVKKIAKEMYFMTVSMMNRHFCLNFMSYFFK